MSLANVAVELSVFFQPLARATESGAGLNDFLGRLGYEVSVANSAAALNQLSNLGNLVDAIGTVVDTALTAANGNALDITPAEVEQIISAGRGVYNTLDGIVALVSPFVGHPPTAELPLEIFNQLVDIYLGTRLQPLRAALTALDVRKTRIVLTGDGDGRDVDYTKVSFDFARLGQFISNTGQWADEVYGWNRSFDYYKALNALSLLVESFVGRPQLEHVDPAIYSAFVSNVPMLPPVTAGDPPQPEPVYSVQLPFYFAAFDDADGDVIATTEAGIVALPIGDMAQRNAMGLALAPFIEGETAIDEAINDRLSFRFEAEGNALGGPYISIRPSGITPLFGGSVDASFELVLSYQKPSNEPIIFLGKPDGTRIQADALLISAGGRMDGDFYIAGGVRGLTAVIDPGDDGLLSALIPDPIIVEAGDILAGVRPGRGFYFESGASLSVDVPLNIDLNLLRIMGLGVKLDWSESFAIDTTLEGELTLGPIYAYADGIGIRTTIVDRPGLLGQNDLAFGFIPPTSYALSLDLSPIEGGGLIELGDTEYRGALALKFKSIGFSAFGILNTELPGGQPGFSFVASIFGEFNLPLGYGFFLTGLGGVVGINRTIDTDAMRAVLFEGRFDNLLFPADPIANAATILDDMAAIFPSRADQHVFGPVARIGWGVPTLISIKLGVIIEVGSQVRLLILGGLSCELPTAEAAIVSLKLSFFGEIDFNGGTISFDATLQGSRILTFSLSGDVAVRTGWASGIEHIVSFGGLHPQFPRPANLPELRRISLDFGTNNPRITVSGYTAITLNSLQFGASLQLYAKGPKIWLIGQLAAEGWAYFNALVIFDPFAFSANLGGGIKLLRNGNVVCGLGFDITLSGPNRFHINGRVWVTVFGQDIDFDIKHSWGSSQSLPPVIADPALVLRSALESGSIEAVAAQGGGAVKFVPLDPALSILDPEGGARFNQNRLPLGVRINRIGEGTIPNGATADIELSRGGQLLTTLESIQSDFVRGHYFQTSQAEKLRATAYDRLKSGVVLASADLHCDASRAVAAANSYEIVRIPVVDEPGTAASPGVGSLTMANEMLERVARARRYIDPADARIVDRERVLADIPGFEVVQFTTPDAIESAILNPSVGTPVAPNAVFDSFVEAELALAVEADTRIRVAGDARVGLGAAAVGPVPAYFALAA